MSYTLLIIDMQRFFKAANNRSVINHCKDQIAKAINDKAHIVFVEYVSYGSTIKSLVKLTNSYRRTYIVRKAADDGSSYISRLIKGYRLPTNLVICGVNTDCCVYKTVAGLHKKIKRAKFNVIKNACWSEYFHFSGLENLNAMSRVSVR